MTITEAAHELFKVLPLEQITSVGVEDEKTIVVFLAKRNATLKKTLHNTDWEGYPVRVDLMTRPVIDIRPQTWKKKK